MLRQTLLTLSRSERVKDLVTHLPVSRGVVDRYIPGDTTRDAVAVVSDLVGAGMLVSLDYLGEHTHDAARAEATVGVYLDLLAALSEGGLAPRAEVSVKLSAVGQSLGHKHGMPGHGGTGEQIALEHARRICRAARNVGTSVTLDMEDHTTTDSTLRILAELRMDFPETGAVLQAYLHRTEDDCRTLAGTGSRVRLCKGAYDEPAAVAYQSRLDVDLAYVRCLKILMNGEGYPMVASHDPRMVAIAEEVAQRAGRGKDDFEFQMLYGIRPDEQRRIVADGYRMRVYVPYGDEWYAYLMRRLAERPSNLRFFLRSLVSTK